MSGSPTKTSDQLNRVKKSKGMLEKDETPQYDEAGKVVSVTYKYKNPVFSIFEDDLYAELYNAYCHDSGEQITEDGARSFREEVLKRNSQSSDVITLYSMRLGINSIISLANSVKCRRLVRLNIADNAISDYGMHHIRDILENTELEYLNLASNMISGDGLETIAEAVSNHKSIKVLDLGIHKGSMRKNSLGVGGAMWISNFLIKNTSLETLILEDNDIGSSGGECLGLALTQCHQLKHLTVSENELNTEGAVHILRNAGNLESLDLSKNYIKSEAGLIIDRLLSKPKQQQNLRRLSLEYNELLHAGAQHIAKGLRVNTTLEKLNLKGNVLGDDGIDYIVSALQSNSTLLDLNLALNEIGPIGASGIANVLQYTSLKKLNLRKNFLGDEASGVFADVLSNVEGQCKLQSLDMSSCRIGDNGIVQFFAAITGNKYLTSVDFRDNFVSERAEATLLEYLEANIHLQRVQLAGNRLSHSCLKKIKKICERNRKESEDAEPNRLKNETYRLKYEQRKLDVAREKLSRQINEVERIKGLKESVISEINDMREAEKVRREYEKQKIAEEQALIAEKEEKIRAARLDLEEIRYRNKSKIEELKYQFEEKLAQKKALDEEIKQVHEENMDIDVEFPMRIREIEQEIANTRKETQALEEQAKKAGEELRRLRAEAKSLKAQKEEEAKAQEVQPNPEAAQRKVTRKGTKKPTNAPQ